MKYALLDVDYDFAWLALSTCDCILTIPSDGTFVYLLDTFAFSLYFLLSFGVFIRPGNSPSRAFS